MNTSRGILPSRLTRLRAEAADAERAAIQARWAAAGCAPVTPEPAPKAAT